MRNVDVITGAFTSDPNEWECLRESAKANGVRLTCFGENAGYPHMDVFKVFEPHVISSSCDYILLTDAYDVMCCRWDEEEVMSLVDREPSGLFVSCEKTCWPGGDWGYGEPETSWWYANGGQYVGRKEAILNLWSEMLSGKWSMELGGTSQEILHRMFRTVQFGRDTQCRVFQSMHGGNGDLLAKDFSNIETGTKPMFLHWNGRTPGMRETYERWKG